MTPPIKSILSCLVILSTASDIHTKEMRELEGPQTLVVPEGNTITVLGEGMGPNDVPIVLYSLDSGSLEMIVYIQSGNPCLFTFGASNGKSINFKTIKKLTDNRLAVIWSITDGDTVRTTFSLLNMVSCKHDLTYHYQGTLSSPSTVAVVPFVNGFELITSDNKRTAYDPNGHQRGTEESFPINSFDFFITPVSEKTRDKGYFIVDNTHHVLNFVRADGTLNRRLLDLTDTENFTNKQHSLYSICTFNPKYKFTVTCDLYDEAGNWLWVNSALFNFDGVADVKTLEGGGIVFTAFRYKDNKLFFVKIGNKLEDVSVWDYSGKQTFQGARLMDFSDKDQMFTLAYKTSEQGPIVSQKFSLLN